MPPTTFIVLGSISKHCPERRLATINFLTTGGTILVIGSESSQHFSCRMARQWTLDCRSILRRTNRVRRRLSTEPRILHVAAFSLTTLINVYALRRQPNSCAWYRIIGIGLMSRDKSPTVIPT